MSSELISPAMPVALVAYAIGVASPGPSNMAILSTAMSQGRAVSNWRAFFSGLAMHLTNPKAIFVWVSIVALALPPDAGQDQAFRVVVACSVIGVAVFFGYALAFSTATARIAYKKVHRLLNATVSAVYAIAGLRLLVSRSSAQP